MSLVGPPLVKSNVLVAVIPIALVLWLAYVLVTRQRWHHRAGVFLFLCFCCFC